jgi:hypothetical protein
VIGDHKPSSASSLSSYVFGYIVVIYLDAYSKKRKILSTEDTAQQIALQVDGEEKEVSNEYYSCDP